MAIALWLFGERMKCCAFVSMDHPAASRMLHFPVLTYLIHAARCLSTNLGDHPIELRDIGATRMMTSNSTLLCWNGGVQMW